MLSFIIIVLVLSSLFRRPRYWGFFPFMSGWGYHGLASSSADGWPSRHGRLPWYGRRVQGRPSRTLLTFPLISGAESPPTRSPS